MSADPPDAVFHRHTDGRVEVVHAPPTSRMALEVVAESDPAVMTFCRDRVELAGQVTYLITGWDAEHACLLLQREDTA